MPRKTKEQRELENNLKELKGATKKTTSKKSVKKTSTNTKKSSTTKKSTTTKPKVTRKTASTTKKPTASSKKSTTKKSVAKKATTVSKKTTSKKVTKSTTKKPAKNKIEIVEYYDLPYRYNQTIVKVLAQTPTNLFIYCDISDEDRKRFEEQYGKDFFETTKPILIVHNDTLNYSFEVEINDFANSWYLHVADSKCDYRIELGRRPIAKNEKIDVDYIYISMSNEIESPNDKILFDKNQKMVYFKNVKTGTQTTKNITSSVSFIRNMGKIYNIYDLYKAIYKDENIEEIYDLSNPSSGNPSSRNVLRHLRQIKSVSL